MKNHSTKYAVINSHLLAHLSTTCSGGALRVVLCPPCVFSHSFKNLLPKHWANLDQTWQECFFGCPFFKNCSQNLILSKTLLAMGTL